MTQASMTVIALNHPQQKEFLLHLFENYTRSGNMTPDQLPLAADTYACVVQSREIPLDPAEGKQPQNIHLGKAKIAEMGPNGVALDFEVQEQ
jgi:hypothetical protein